MAATADAALYVVLGLVIAIFGTVLALNPAFRSAWVRFSWRNASDETVRRFGIYGWAVAALGVAVFISGLA
ncbi:MAG TPA: hypothetical protein VFH56_09295 [Acidimicrobiales bacterium]|nr:hypothetical protein [Acidimicrobiales bacterium]